AAGTALLLLLVFHVDYLIVGRLLGASALAYYTLGFRIPELVIISVFNVISVVAFPLFSRVRENEQRLHGGYLLGLRVQAIYGAAAGVGLAMAAPMIVNVVFGRTWGPAIVPLEALALYATFRSLGLGPHEAFRGIGRPDLLVRLSLLRLAVVAPALLIGARFGIDGVSWAQAAAALPLALVMQVVASRVLGIPLRQIIRALRPAVAVALGVALAMAPVRVLMIAAGLVCDGGPNLHLDGHPELDGPGVPDRSGGGGRAGRRYDGVGLADRAPGKRLRHAHGLYGGQPLRPFRLHRSLHLHLAHRAALGGRAAHPWRLCPDVRRH